MTYLEYAHCLRSIIQIIEDNSIDTTRINIDSKNTQTGSPSIFLNFELSHGTCYIITTGSASDKQSTNDRKVAGSRPTKVVCVSQC